MSIMNNKLYQEYMNLISDSYRAIYEFVEPKIDNNRIIQNFISKNYV